MTQPTQAQIEAEHHVVIYAAACNPDVTGDNAAAVLRHIIRQARAALTAAAQVGELAPCDDAEFGTYDHVINDRNATIERCAQEAEQTCQ